MKVLFVVPYPIGQAPSQRFRFEQQFSFLKSNNINCDVQAFWDLQTWKILYKPGHVFQKAVGFIMGWCRRFAMLFRLNSYELVFLHREAAPIGPPIIEWFIAKVFKKKIIYDFDDAIWLPNVSNSNSFISSLKWYDKVKSICKWSWKISCGNEYLAAFAKKYNSSVYIIPTTIDTNYHKQATSTKSFQKVVIGWTGSLSTDQYLKQLEEVFKRLGRKHQFELVIISNHPPALSYPHRFVKWNLENEITDLSQIDIGIMPLPDDEWSRGKCGFKLIQYGALAMPSVASPVGVNRKIIEEGVTGFLATSDEEWFKALERLITDTDSRNTMGNQAKKNIEENYSSEAAQGAYLNLFYQAG